ncbi:MAG: Mut7-C RNAse domain-containing protein [Candidatus Caldarchaeum sp.]|uniref:Mut7-C RNAse domain-containing protein n=1 Tax=Caldiarchaeum subterraneum TaxID=311458 RepID=A0A7C5LAN7_CALS0
MRFFLDTMLGHLVTWLRLLGYDTVYNRSLRDEEAIAAAKAEGRVFVTRDRNLAQKSRKIGVQTVLLETTDTVESLRIISKTVGISLAFEEERSRCPECNSVLAKVSVNPVKWSCPYCGKSYWIGRHWRNISKTLKLLQG